MENFSEDIKEMQNKHKGERCFIIGSGPSLNKTNMKLLKNEILFGTNTLYKGYKEYGINCQYYAVSDADIWLKESINILKLDTTLFISDNVLEAHTKEKLPSSATIVISTFEFDGQKKQVYVLKNIGKMWKAIQRPILTECPHCRKLIVDPGCFSLNIMAGIYSGNVVTADICLQVCFYLGFSKVYLVGCDSDMTGDFDGKSYQSEEPFVTPRPIESYKLCKKAYEKYDREIINCTVGGKLEVFKREKLEDVI
jgi:hypothetical protein